MASFHPSSTPKIERRVIEKNRRNHMKSLYSKLYSLLPNHSSKEAVPLPDQIDEAVNYITSLQAKVEKSKEKKETLSGTKKRSHTSTNESIPTFKSPKIEIHEMGHAFNVTLVTGHDDKFIFHEILRIIHEEGAEVLTSNFSVIGNSVFHSIHAKAVEFAPDFGLVQVTNKLKEFVYGSMCDVPESMPAQSCDFEIQPEINIGFRNSTSTGYGSL